MRRSGRSRRRRLSARQEAYLASGIALAARRAGAEAAADARRKKRPCGAKAKSSGEPCRNPGMENGRCRLHGGLTPKGKNWHRVQWPASDAPPEKLEKKLRELKRRQLRREARVAAMTPEERARYEAWHRTHRAGSPTDRARLRHDREARRLFRNVHQLD
jgi:hypothetical protein